MKFAADPRFRTKLLPLLCLLGVLALGLAIRLQPLKYGVYLYEYDPYFMLYTTKYLVDNGPLSWFELTRDNVRNFWYPTGRNVYSTEFPGVPLIGYLSYNIARLFVQNVPEEDLLLLVADVLPPIFGLISILGAYLIGLELRDWRTGLLAAFFTSISPAAIDRTIAGFYTKLGFGTAFYILSLYFLVRSLKRESWISAVVSGLFLGLIGLTWGGISYAILSYALILALLVLLNLNNLNTVRSFTIIFAIGLTTCLLVPKLGVNFVSRGVGLLALVSLVLSYLDFYLRRVRVEDYKRIIGLLVLVSVSVGGFLAVSLSGLINVPQRQLSIIFPWIRSENVIFVSVAEHHPPSWDYLISSLSIPFMLTPLGVYLSLKSRRSYEIAVALPAIGALYGASSAAYLMNLAGPLTSILGGIGLAKIFESTARELSKREVKVRKRGKSIVKVEGKYVLTAILIVLVLASTLTPSTVRAGDQIPTILSSGLPYRIINRAWLKALDYIRNNLPEDAVVVTWWDYGYWVTVVGNRTSLADNATINGTQISYLARALVSNENVSAKIMLDVLRTPPNSTYVLVYDAFQTFRSGNESYLILLSVGDVPKSYWMVRIGGLNVSEYFDTMRGGLNWASDSVKEALIYNILWESADTVGRELGYMPSIVMQTAQGPAVMPLVPGLAYSGLKMFVPEYVAWDASNIGGTSIVVIVGIYKLNVTALG